MEPEEITQPVQEPTVPPEPVEVQEKPGLIKRFWFIPLTFILLFILLMVGYLFTNQNLDIFNLDFFKKTPQVSPTPSPATESETASLEKQGTSDEISEIEADLSKTDLSDLDKELTDIEEELTSP
ncbi:MAG TPA: hypothetical protein VMY36_03640 [Patescibacteria group bacterium]|nr:hypothetical protein [Patescibacteria group bacterium]